MHHRTGLHIVNLRTITTSHTLGEQVIATWRRDKGQGLDLLLCGEGGQRPTYALSLTQGPRKAFLPHFCLKAQRASFSCPALKMLGQCCTLKGYSDALTNRISPLHGQVHSAFLTQVYGCAIRVPRDNDQNISVHDVSNRRAACYLFRS